MRRVHHSSVLILCSDPKNIGLLDTREYVVGSGRTAIEMSNFAVFWVRVSKKENKL